MDRFLRNIYIFQIEYAADVEDVNEPTEILNQMKKSRLLAQMLGYLFFLPYRTDETQLNRKPIAPINVEVYLQSQISLRSYQGFPIDLTSTLVTSLTQKRLVFTLPWILEFLSQADQVTFHLPKFKSVLSLISCIYREFLVLTPTGPEVPQLCLENKTFLRFFCGKLFGLSTFPDSFLFRSEIMKLQDFLPQSQLPIRGSSSTEENIFLDMQSFIGSTLIPIWFSSEMKQMMRVLTANATVKGSIPISSPGIVKHVRPIPEPILQSPTSENHSADCSTESVEESLVSPKANLQLDLEIQFFSIHPHSVKKTVDFIAERVASNFVKQLRNQILLDIKKDLINKGVFEERAVIDCKNEIWKQMTDFTAKRCEDSVNLLIGEVVSEGVKSICQVLTTRKSNEKICQWVDQHITKG